MSPSSSIEAKAFIPWTVTSRLASIEIRNLDNVPIALFDTCHNLRTLNVLEIRLAPFEEFRRIPVEKRPLIRKLLVADREDLICHTGFWFNALERLVFQGSLTYRDLDTIQHIFTDTDSDLSSLEYLNFFLPGTYHAKCRHILLITNPSSSPTQILG